MGLLDSLKKKPRWKSKSKFKNWLIGKKWYVLLAFVIIFTISIFFANRNGAELDWHTIIIQTIPLVAITVIVSILKKTKNNINLDK